MWEQKKATEDRFKRLEARVKELEGETSFLRACTLVEVPTVTGGTTRLTVDQVLPVILKYFGVHWTIEPVKFGLAPAPKTSEN